MRARLPDIEGYAERDGVKLAYEVHGADNSGIPAASASNTRIVGMPGSDCTYGRRGMCIVTR